MLKKSIYGLVLALFVISMLYFDPHFPLWLNITVAFVCIISAYELSTVLGVSKKKCKSTLSFWGLSALFFSVMPFVRFGVNLLFVWYVYTLLYMVLSMALRNAAKLKSVFSFYTLNVMIAFFLRMLIELRDIGGVHGNFFVFWVFLIACITDTGAYFGGSFLGKHKLCPDLSPKKTIEGSVIGLAICLLVVWIVMYCAKTFVYGSVLFLNYGYILIITAIGSIISMTGDLFFSFIKRSCKVKDFGDVIPGHGGILDRVDSVIFVSPFVLFMLKVVFCYV